MIEGRMKKFFSEVTLLGQDFVVDPDLTVQAASEKVGVQIVGYIRMAVGEGIEKRKKILPLKLPRLQRVKST